MKRHIVLIVVVLRVLLAAATNTIVAPASAQSDSGYDLTWGSITNGGATLATAGAYSLGSAIGQTEAATTSGGSSVLLGGFWSRVSQNSLYLPIILK